MKKIRIVILAIFLLVGCNGTSGEVVKIKDDKIVALESELNVLRDVFDKLQKENSNLESTIEDLKLKQENRKIEIEQLKSEFSEKYNNLEVYYKTFYELENVQVPRAMGIKSDTSIRNYPYDMAHKMSPMVRDQFVIIHTVVQNDNNEEWALVEYPALSSSGVQNYGYIKLDELEDKVYQYYSKSSVEAIGGIEIGNKVEKAISVFGDKISTYNGEIACIYKLEDASININPISYTVDSIVVTSPGYMTNEGVEVGDDLQEVIKIYKEKYKMNENEVLYEEHPETIFKLDEHYVIQFSGKEGKVSSISIYDIYSNW
jgi:hypothetical protein